MINFVSFVFFPIHEAQSFQDQLKNYSKNVNHLVDNGSKEITLLGQNVNAYNFEGKKLSDLIFKFHSIEILKRIRYTTSHPIDFSEDLISAHQ